METATVTSRRPATERLAVTAITTMTGSLLLVLLIRGLTVAFIDVPSRFMPLAIPSDVSLTIIGVLLATGAWALVKRRSANPVTTFRRVASVALVISFIPDIAIWASKGYDGAATTSTVLPLMLMHVGVGALCIALLPTANNAPGRSPAA